MIKGKYIIRNGRNRLLVVFFIPFLLVFTYTSGCSEQLKENDKIHDLDNGNNEMRDDDMNEKYTMDNQIVIPIDQLDPSRLETATLALG